jgi:hypothetical protein
LRSAPTQEHASSTILVAAFASQIRLRWKSDANSFKLLRCGLGRFHESGEPLEEFMFVSKLTTVLVLCFSFAIASASAQDQTQSKAQPQTQSQTSQSQAPATPPAPPPAKPADVASADALLAATYDVISGPPGKRDWDRFRSLFLPGAHLAAVRDTKDASLSAKSFTPEEYVTFGDAYFMKNGFFEREASRHADRYANIMQIFSTYESRHDSKDSTPFARGINSFQLFFDGSRWWIVSIFWQEESPDAPIPAEFLPKAR